jgi:ABC-type branched-subunit amino acid transport system substrate-binding protein
MRTVRTSGAIAAVALLTVAAACSSSGSTGGGGSGGTPTVTIGVLTDVTGLAASGNKTTVDGVAAGVVYAARNGVNVKYVIGDTATNPTQVLAVARKLVTQDRVAAVVAVSALTQSAATYLTSRHIPVVGAAQDGPEWQTATNMFAVTGAIDETKVTSTYGLFFSDHGVTTVGSLGYGASPLSAQSARSFAASSAHAGLKVGFINANFPFGSTNVAPVAIQMKNANVDGLSSSTDPNTAFALIESLRQYGVGIKVALLPTGYGGDTLQAGAGTLKEAQNVYFAMQYETMEMKTAATQQFASDLKAAGITVPASLATYHGYVSVGLLARAVKAAKGNVNSAGIQTALEGIHDWDALGLFGGRTIDINDRASNPGGTDACMWAAKLVGTEFHAVAGADPLCGKVIPGLRVSAN